MLDFWQAKVRTNHGVFILKGLHRIFIALGLRLATKSHFAVVANRWLDKLLPLMDPRWLDCIEPQLPTNPRSLQSDSLADLLCGRRLSLHSFDHIPLTGLLQYHNRTVRL